MMRTAGQLLKEKREKLELTFEQIEKAIRIRRGVLKNIEDSRWDLLPSPTHVKGFIRNYGDYLNLDTHELLALFRREVDEKKTTTPKHVFRTHLLRGIGLRPQLLIGVFVGLIIIGFFGYIYREYRSFIAPPYLEVIEPSDNLKTQNNQLTVVGNTDTQAILKINGTQVDLSPGGTFSVPLNLAQGKSTIIISSENRFGGVSTVKRDVTIEGPPLETVSTASATPEPQTLEIKLKIGSKAARVTVDSDTSEDFDGTLQPNSEKSFSGEKLIKVKTQNAGSTSLVYKGKTEVLGKDGEVKEIEVKP